MKDVQFKKVSAQNFRVYKNKIEFPFQNGKLILITGPNGIGKTTIFQILCHTLYGSSDKVVNREVGKNCVTAVNFSIDGEEYVCERYVKDSKLGNTAILYKSGVPIKKGHKEVVAEIEKILVSEKVFFNTLFFGQKVKTFFTDLVDSEQKEIFRKILPLECYKFYYDEIHKNRIKFYNESLNKISSDTSLTEGLIVSAENQINGLISSEKRFDLDKQNKVSDFRSRKALKTKEAENLNNGLNRFPSDIDDFYENLKLKINELNANINLIKSKRDNESLKVTSLKDKENYELMSSYNKQVSEVKGEHQKNNNDISNKSSESIKNLELGISNGELSLKNLRLAFNNNTDNGKKITNELCDLKKSLTQEKVYCPLCKQELGKDNLVHIETEISKKEKEITDIKLILDKIKAEGSEWKKFVEEKTTNINSLKNRLKEELSKELERYNGVLRSVEKDKNFKLSEIVIKYKGLSDEVVSKYNDELEKLEKENSTYRVKKEGVESTIFEKNNIQKSLDSIYNDIKIIDSNIKNTIAQKFDFSLLETVKENKKNLEGKLISLKSESIKVENQVKMGEFWKEGFSMIGIPAMLIDEAIPFMNKRIAEYLNAIGGRYQASFDTLKKKKDGEFSDKISVNVLDTVTKCDDREQFSGGQTRIIDIATIFTLRDLQSSVQNMKMNIILLDEIFDSLDDKNIGYVSNILRKLCKDDISINVISHTQIDQLEADDVLKFY